MGEVETEIRLDERAKTLRTAASRLQRSIKRGTLSIASALSTLNVRRAMREGRFVAPQKQRQRHCSTCTCTEASDG